MNSEFDKWWASNKNRYNSYMITKECALAAFEARDPEIKKLKTNVKTLKTKLKKCLT